ncbi:MAG TPA: aminoadenine-incorporating DNA polymerase DpoZ [Actinomycetota bacterium]|nr:aminoadenine-incorporating DNA polymerase DpoZ [Actinomycetota bacterium]
MPKLNASAALLSAARDALELNAAGDVPVPVPSEVLKPGSLGVPVAVDTETNGLYADDGVRTAIVSVGWIPDEIVRDEAALRRAIETGEGVVDYAFPFDQGVRDKVLPTWARKKYAGGQMDLFATDDVNLPQSEWDYLLLWLFEQESLDFHNAKFDLEKLRVGTRHWGGVDLAQKVGWDSQLVAKELWPLENSSLKPTSERLWGVGEADEQRVLKRWLGPKTEPGYDLVPWHIIAPYAAKDTNLTTRLCWHQRLLVAEDEIPREWVEEALEYMQCLYLMEKRGMPYDASRSLDAAEVLERHKQELARQLPFTPSVNAAKAYYFGHEPGQLGLIPVEVTEKGEPALNEDVLRRLREAGAPHIEEYSRWRKYDTAQTMWYRGYAEMVGPDGRLRTCFRQTHVRSGRISVERFQAQALPHSGKLKLLPDDVPHPRSLFPFPNGWEVDLAQAELRVAAKKARCQAMIEMIEAGEDLHGIVTTELFGVRKGDPEWFDLRQVGKRADFSFIFGVGWRKFQQTIRELLGISFSDGESQEIVAKWRAMFPEFGRAIQTYSRFALAHHYVELANGKRRWFTDYELQYGGHQAFNQYVQPSLAELAKDWTIDTERRHPGILVMTVHDSQYLDLPGDLTEDQSSAIASDVAARAAELGTEMFGIVMEADVSRWGEH